MSTLSTDVNTYQQLSTKALYSNTSNVQPTTKRPGTEIHVNTVNRYQHTATAMQHSHSQKMNWISFKSIFHDLSIQMLFIPIFKIFLKFSVLATALGESWDILRVNLIYERLHKFLTHKYPVAKNHNKTGIFKRIILHTNRQNLLLLNLFSRKFDIVSSQ